jgi:hypothetical protein
VSTDYYLGDTVRVKFTTTNGNGQPVAPSAAFVASDFRIYKNSLTTQKSTTNGITVTSPFASVVGRHFIAIDTANSTGDVGFWESGAEYWVEINSTKTVDGFTQSGVEVGRFSLQARYQSVSPTRAGYLDKLDFVGSLPDAVATAVHNGTIGQGTVGINSGPREIKYKSLNFAHVVNDQLRGRVLLFKRDTLTPALRLQGAPIVGSTSDTIWFTLENALTTAPQDNDEFVIV